MSSPRGDDDLADLLSELRATLDRLDRELRDDRRTGAREGGRDRAPAPRDRDGRSRARRRPPSVSELLRFTDEYTIPTVVSLLEATIRSLELLQGALRLLDPERSARLGRGERDAGPRLPTPADAARSEVTENARRALSELRTALSEADLPDEPESRGIVADARRLSAEIERRIDESERAERDRRRTDAAPGTDREPDERGREGVRIDVAEEDDPERGDDDPGRDDDPERPGDAVDVEAELRSIKDEIDDASGEESDADPDGGGSAAADGSDADETDGGPDRG